MNSPYRDTRKKKPRLIKALIWIFSTLALIAIMIYIAFQVSPWPSVWLIRRSFQKEGRAANEKLAKYIPNNVLSKTDIRYDETSNDALLDLYYPGDTNATGKKYPLIVWVHGGGFVAGDKDELANYCKLLASKGFIVAAANYSLAPGANFPVPTRQINTAIGFLVKHASDLAIDSSQIVVAGDSGGAHTTAQLANAFTDPQFAAMLNISPSTDPANLKGVILFCGPYNGALADLNGSFGWFLKTVLWSYIGQKDFTKAPSYKYFSISDYITTHFPKTFISVGNNDPLRLHSYELATRLSSKGVTVDSLFFPDNYAPALPHEYQFNLDNAAGQLALNRTLEFLSSCFAKGHPR